MKVKNVCQFQMRGFSFFSNESEEEIKRKLNISPINPKWRFYCVGDFTASSYAVLRLSVQFSTLNRPMLTMLVQY